MSAEFKMIWKGASGTEYQYDAYKIGTSFKDLPANYIFARMAQPNSWSPVYIGETSSLNERFNSHHKEDCILKNGATYVFVHSSSPNQNIRIAEETDLRTRFKTSCNDQ